MIFKKDGTHVADVSAFSDPYGLTVNKGQITVADYSHNRIQLITRAAQQPHIADQSSLTILGTGYDLKFPTAVAYTADGRLMVSEYLSGLIKVLTILRSVVF